MNNIPHTHSENSLMASSKEIASGRFEVALLSTERTADPYYIVREQFDCDSNTAMRMAWMLKNVALAFSNAGYKYAQKDIQKALGM